ncbi:hypothetical protein METSCH_A08990 [Metschnikowia aff. pulcherrima]|uniref:Uncharacterized protein n=1 Tax=Metschnikowia aff. pulcherrima TaxID=2163413 RepID=A0A4P6XFW8_9ASCO|nr:hypothetical protein METSCH_A08990 [Metschnikowia aff. pulcherrima]
MLWAIYCVLLILASSNVLAFTIKNNATVFPEQIQTSPAPLVSVERINLDPILELPVWHKINWQKRIFEPQLPDINKSLKRHVERLREYVKEASFDVTSYESKKDVLRKQIIEIGSLALETYPISMPNWEMYNFIKYLHSFLSDSIALLKDYNANGRPGCHLTYSVIDLNLKLLALCDDFGKPDRLAAGYVDKVIRYALYLRFLKQEYASASLELRLQIFEQHFARADTVLMNLIRDLFKASDDALQDPTGR